MGKILSIDFGLARIGLAISDINQSMALSLPTIRAGRTFELSIQNILEAIDFRLKELESIVIGLPLNMDGSEGDMAKKVREFGGKLATAINLPVFYFDERLTSAGADSSLKELRLNRKKRTKMKDQVAAVFILQSFLESKKHTS